MGGGVRRGALLLDGAGAGPWNMAFDEALLLAGGLNVGGEPAAFTLRLYAWRPATLSLGYFQRYQDRESHPASAAAPVVRRQTGGGAIAHDCEITYSLAVRHLPGTGAAERLYRDVHSAWIEALAGQGVTASFYCDVVPCQPCPPRNGETAFRDRATQDEPFLCFQRRTPFDVVVGGGSPGGGLFGDERPTGQRSTGAVKVIGSAQRRRRESVLQHGSVLLARSGLAPELPGLAETAGASLDEIRLKTDFVRTLRARLACEFFPSTPAAATIAAAEEIMLRKFGEKQYTRKR